MTRIRSRVGLLVIAALVGLATLLGFGAAPARAEEPAAKEAVVDGKIAKDGGLEVKQVLTFANAAPGTLTERIALTEETFDKAQYNFDVTDVTAKVDDKDVSVSPKKEGTYLVVDVPTNGGKKVEIAYKVKGAAHGAPENTTQFRWRFIQGFNVPIDHTQLNVDVPGMFRDVDCKAGSPAAAGVCQAFYGGTHQSMNPSAEHGALGAGEMLQLMLRFDSKSLTANDRITQMWSLDRAFDFSLWPLLAALGTLALGALALWAAHRRAGRDSGYANPTRIAEFRPVGEGTQEFNVLHQVRPGQVGSLVDERVDPIDIAASLIDLAVRRHLRIVELPRERNRPLDWTFERRTDVKARDELAPFEKHLMEVVAPADGTPVKVSQLGGALGAKLGDIQSDMYDEMVRQGWYNHRPDDTRRTWRVGAYVALALALVALGLLVAFTHFGLLGLVLVVLALGVLLVSREMPARTEKGASMLAGLMALRSELLNEPTNQMPRGREYTELSEVLPYSVVLGGSDRWLQAIVDADDDLGTPDPEDLDWYHAPEDWQLQDLPSSLDQLITTITGKLIRR